MAVRLQKAIADAGITSRRKAETLIESGRVFLNDKKDKLGDKYLSGDKIYIDCKEIKFNQPKQRLIIYHKPIGEICSKSGYGKPTVFDNTMKNPKSPCNVLSEGKTNSNPPQK